MKASIIVATYNRKGKLEKCLNALANQTLPEMDYEIVLVDDGSTDGTYEFLKEKQKDIKNLRIFRQKNKGPASARNFGIKNSSGQIIFFTDDDVIVPNNWIEEFLKIFEKCPEVVAVGGYLEASDELIKRNVFAKYEAYMSRLVYNMPEKLYVGGFETFGGVTCNAAYEKKVIEEVGYFDETFPVAAGEDADLKLRVSLNGHKFAFIPLKATHIQDYNFKRFWGQQIARGIGDVYFAKKWESILKTDKEKDKYNAKPKYDVPLHILTDLKFDIFLLFMISVLASRYGKLKAKHV